MTSGIFANHDLNKIYLSEALRNLGNSMIQVFIPIYLLLNGYSLRQVVIFYIISSVVHIGLAIPVGLLGAKLGYKYLILLSVPFLVIFYIFLRDLSGGMLWQLWTLSVIKEIGGTFYWVGRHSLLGFYTDKDRIGVEVGINKILSSIAKIPAPLIGGLILTAFSIQPLIVLVTALLLCSVIPLALVKENWPDREFSTAKVFSRLHLKNAPIFIVQGIDNVIASDLVWPTYLYFYLSLKYVGLGLVHFFGDIASLLANYIVGRFTDRNYRQVLRLGAVSAMVIWTVRLLAKTPLQVYAIDSAAGITDPMVHLPFGAVSYRIAKESHFLQMIVFREIAIQTGKLLAFGAVFFINSLRGALLIGLLYPLGYLVFKFYNKQQVSD